MAGLGIGIAWFGYAVFYYGFTQLQGGNWGFLDLVVPGRWANAKNTPKDSPGGQATGAAGFGSPAPLPLPKGTVHGTGVITGPDGKLYNVDPNTGALTPAP